MSELVEQLGEHLRAAPPRERRARHPARRMSVGRPGRDDSPDRLYTLTGGRSRSRRTPPSTW